MSHKLQLHLLLDHISAKITANAAIGLHSLASHACNNSSFVFENSGYRSRKLTSLGSRSWNQYVRKSNISLQLSNVQLYPHVLHLLNLRRNSRCSVAQPRTPIACDFFISGEIQIAVDRFYRQKWGVCVCACFSPWVCFYFLSNGY